MVQTFNLDDHDTTPKITSEYVLEHVDDLLIFRYYLGDFSLNKAMSSPLRVDKKPSFKITMNKEWLKLQYKDWTTGEAGDCFKFVARKFGISWNEAVYKVACDFGIVKGNCVISKKQLQEAREFKEKAQSEYKIIVDPREMGTAEIAYWEQFSITKEDLKKNHIYGIKHLWVNDKEFILRGGLHFAYYFPDVDKFKIYNPLDKDWKWFGNVSAFQMEGLEELKPDPKPLIITKSRKDRIVLSKLYPNVCSSQNEAETAIPKELDDKFDSMYPAKYCWYDCDEAGKNANKKLNYRGYKWINIPNIYYQEFGIKDPSDLVKFYGIKRASEIIIQEINKKFKNNGIIT